MIANEGLSGGHFGSGRLLDDLVQYVYNGLGCRLMLIGEYSTASADRGGRGAGAVCSGIAGLWIGGDRVCA